MASVRRALIADQDAVLVLMRGYCQEVGTPLSDEHLLDAIGPLIANEQLGDLLVAEQGEDLAGYLVITWGWGIESGGAEALIDEMFVAAEYRHQGVGTLLMTEGQSRASAKDVKVIFLETEQNNPESRELYDRLGFEIESSIWMSKRI
jgi:ribosomal protein S18 acetylase RimI-like enzyme